MIYSTILKYIRFKIDKRYYFEFDVICNDVDPVNFFVGSELKYFFTIVMQIIKSTTARKYFKEYSETKNSYAVMNFRANEVTLELQVMTQLPMK
jgi:hypothetical protein